MSHAPGSGAGGIVYHSLGSGSPSCQLPAESFGLTRISRDNSDVCAGPLFLRVTHCGPHPHNNVFEDSVSLVGIIPEASAFLFQDVVKQFSQALRKPGLGIPSHRERGGDADGELRERQQLFLAATFQVRDF